MISAAGGVEGFIASIVFEKGINVTMWSIHWDIKLLAYVYGGIMCSGLANYISGYILQEKGPVFLTSFNPLTMLIVAVMSSFILSEQLELGKVVGGIVIVVGVYLVLWAEMVRNCFPLWRRKLSSRENFTSLGFWLWREKTLESYKALLFLTAMISAAGGVEGFIASIVFEKGINVTMWSIHWDIKLLAYVYGGIFCSGLVTYISGYVLKEKGTVFLTSFNPLTMLIVAVMSSFILSEQLELGKVVGGIVIVVGVYLVLWGKTKDDHNSSSMKALPSSHQILH
ncbi:unnamed protein product [Fraxinus pennsylvanica]|uniref:WAT1-related protein n=1 Tax=Fraxinus pennsylvanica TaxID=56036 RepID=A0AAD1ZQJ4_9LAMI|nr:unnamed protein product [Fraxinus pennsylvanica]